MKQSAIYIMASGRTGTLYVGVTSDLIQRIGQHRFKAIPGFASKYGCTRLVHCELFETMEVAIAREKVIKGGSRARKRAMIEAGNPVWRDLWGDILS